MRIHEVGHVDVVPDSRAVRRLVAATCHCELLQKSFRGVKHRRAQANILPVLVGSRLLIDSLSHAGQRVCTNHIEVPENDSLPRTSRLLHVAADEPVLDLSLRHELRPAVRRDWFLRRFLRDGEHLGRSVRGTRGGEDDVFHAVLGHRIQHVQGVASVVPVVHGRVVHGLASIGDTRKVHDRPGSMFLEHSRESHSVSQVDVVELN
mmetsp:Transcript_5915/g.16671  ORF Transcript_5915/g.16671 Transcript_5915/m.16671 type:complete len:206 (+) Transcript_5915:434-1051(+)